MLLVRSVVFSKIVRKLPSSQSASRDALAVMLCRPLGGLRCGHRKRVKQIGYIRGAIILL